MEKNLNKAWKGIISLIFSYTLKNTSIVFIGTIVSSVFGIIFTVISAKYLGPENWGIVAAVWNLVNILVAFGDFGLGSAFFQHASGKWSESATENNRIYRTVFTIRLLSILVISFLLFIASRYISQTLLHLTDSDIIVYISLAFAGVLLLDFQIFAIQSKRLWLVSALLSSLTNVFRVLILVLLVGTGGLNLKSVLMVFSLTSLLPFLVSLYWIGSFPGFYKEWKALFANVRRFSFWMGLNKIVSSISPRLNILIIIQMLGVYEAGIYGAAERMAMGVPQIFGSLAAIIAQRFASLDNHTELRKFFRKSVYLSVLLASGLLFGVFITPFIISFFGEKYVQAGSILQWSLVSFIPFALATPAVNLLIYRFKKPETITFLSLLQLPAVLIGNYYLLPKIGLYAPVVILGSINTLTMVVSYFYALRYLRLRV